MGFARSAAVILIAVFMIAFTCVSGLASEWTTTWDALAIAGDYTIWGSYTEPGQNIRIIIQSSDTIAEGTKVRLTFRGHATYVGEISGAAIGVKKSSSDPWDFTSTPTNITFGDGNETGVLPANGFLVSDEIDFTFDGDTDYLVSIYSTDGDQGFLFWNNASYCNYNLGYDDSMTVAPSWNYWSNDYIEWLARIEVYGANGWETAWDALEVTGETPWGDFTSDDRNARIILDSAETTTGGSKVRLTLKGHSGSSSQITGASIGPKKANSDPWDFDATPTNITFDSGNDSAVIPTGGVLISDMIDFEFDSTVDYLVAIYSANGKMAYLSYPDSSFYRTGIGWDQTMMVNPNLSYYSNDYIEWLAKVDVYTEAGGDGDGDGYTVAEGDCDDTDPDINPGETEVCDGIDNNCDTQVDEGVTVTFYLDADGDEYGYASSTIQACSLPSGYATNQDDCDDTDPDINPDTVWYEDADGDDYTTGNTLTQCIQPNGYVLSATAGDCDDTDAGVNPGATEICDGIDNNCNATVDEGVTVTYYLDGDDDDYGVDTSTTEACTEPSGYAGVSGDCNDADSAVNPGAEEVCDGIDNNCDGIIDSDCLTGIVVDPESFTLSGLSASQQLVVTGYYADGSSEDLTASSGFTSSNPSAATVTSGGLVSSVAAGSSIITVGSGGYQVDAWVTVQILPVNYDPQPEGFFGSTYEDLVPSDITIDSYDENRFSIITGFVENTSGAPISSVVISIFDHPEYGSALTDLTGRFAIPVEGEGTMTVQYEKTGLLTLQRKVEVPWNDIASTPGVTMIQRDQSQKTVMFNDNPAFVNTYRNTPTVDEYGMRTLTMVISGDNRAFIYDSNGYAIYHTFIDVSATEYQTPGSMPAQLPPTSAFTYCVELTADEGDVQFEKPVKLFVENFIGFDVGTIVPVGYYDKEKAVWIPMKNGVVVRLLDEDEDGEVDGLDVDDDGQPDDLNGNGSTADEALGLADSLSYPPGDTFWHATVKHFSPIDLNFPAIPPEDAKGKSATFSTGEGGAIVGNSHADQNNGENKPGNCSDNNGIPKQETGSYVNYRTRVLEENIPIIGTGFVLHYSSNRVEDYLSVITVPASGSSVPSTLLRIELTFKVAGNVFTQTLDALPNQQAVFKWDGKDFLGNPTSGSIKALVTVDYIYRGYFEVPLNRPYTFGLASGIPTTIDARVETGIPEVEEIIIEREGSGTIAKGWTLSAHHQMNPSDPTVLVKGDGSILKSKTLTTEPFAGNGTYTFSGDGGPAVEAGIGGWVCNITSDPDGNIFFFEDTRIRKVDTEGIITTIAENSSIASGGTNIAVIDDLYCDGWDDLEADKDGNVYLGSSNIFKILKISTNGSVETIAGECTPEVANSGNGLGDGGPAHDACIDPFGVALDDYGNVFISDYWNNPRVRKIDTNGVITTIAGYDDFSYTDDGDGGPATEASFNLLPDVEVDFEGNVYVPSVYGYRVRKVDPYGIVTTVIGTGSAGSGCALCGEGGPALEADIFGPWQIEVDKEGNIYFLDYDEEVIRLVDTSGNIHTVAGISGLGVAPYYDCEQEGIPATASCFGYTNDFALDPEGNLYIHSDSLNKIMKISLAGKTQRFRDVDEVGFMDNNGLVHILSSAGLHLRTVDINTGVVLFAFGYNTGDQLVSIEDRFGNETTIQRDASGIPESITSPDEITTGLSIDENNNLRIVSFPDGNDYEMEYTTGGLMTDIYHPNGDLFTHTFNNDGRVVEAADPEGGNWLFDREVDGQGAVLTTITTGEGEITEYLDEQASTGQFIATLTGKNGEESNFSISTDGLTRTMETACGTANVIKAWSDPEYGFNIPQRRTVSMPSGLSVASSIDRSYTDTNADEVPDLITDTMTVNGKVSTFENDVLNGTVTATSPTGRQVTSYYSPTTLLTSRTSTPGLFDTIYAYDGRGRLQTVTVGTRSTSFSYDSYGYLDYMVTSDNRTFDYSYDIMGRLTDEDRPDGSHVDYYYDNNGNVTVITNPNSIDHEFTYTANDQRESYASPLSGSYTYQYDKDRRLEYVTYPSGATITNTWGNGQLQSTSTPEGLISYGYNCGSKLGSVSKGGESASYTYDGSLLLTDTRAGTVGQTIIYGYNADMQVGSITYAGVTESFLYDNDGLLTDAGPYTVSRNAQNGLPESVTDGTVTQGRDFSGYGEVDGVDYTVGAVAAYSWAVSRDNAGRITFKVENFGAGANTVTWEYTYDDMGRLETVYKDSSLAEVYSYDGQGNRTSETNILRNLSRSYTHDDEDKVVYAGADSYVFDTDGFLTSRTIASGIYSGTATFDYSSRGELLSASLPAGMGTITFTHDPMGRRIAKSVNGTVVEKYLWQDATTLLAVYDGSDNLIQRFEYADGRMPVAMTAGAQVYYLAYDQVGSLRAVFDSAGSEVKRINYDSFGNILSDSNPSFSVPFGFAGGLHDGDIGLVRFGARDYDPATGKWTAKDPIDFAGRALNLLSYTGQDPVNFVDPEGLSGLLIGMEPLLLSSDPILFGRGPYINIPRHLRGPVRNIPQEPLPRIRPSQQPKWTPEPYHEIIPEPSWLGRLLENLADLLDELGLGGGTGGMDNGSCPLPQQGPEGSPPYQFNPWYPYYEA